MSRNEIFRPRSVSPVPRCDERGVLVPQVVGDSGIGIPVLPRLNSVGVSPIVERGERKPQLFGNPLVDPERNVFPHAGEQKVVGLESFGVLGEDPPRPELGRSGESVAPLGLPAFGPEGRRLEVRSTSRGPLDHLPLGTEGRHKGFQRVVGFGQMGDERLGLSPVQMPGFDDVGLSSLHISHEVGIQDVLPNEPLPELLDSGVVSVLGRARDFESVQMRGDLRLGEIGERESLPFGDEQSDLLLVLRGFGGPLIDQRREVGGVEVGQECIELARLVGIVNLTQRFAFVVHGLKRRPLPVVLEGPDHPLDVVRDLPARSTARKDLGSVGIKGDAGLPPEGALGSERHGKKMASRYSDRYIQRRNYMKSDSVSGVVPGAGVEPARFYSGDFERPATLNPRNNLASPHSSAPPHPRTARDTSALRVATSFATRSLIEERQR